MQDLSEDTSNINSSNWLSPVRVFISGEVKRPGYYMLSGMKTERQQESLLENAKHSNNNTFSNEVTEIRSFHSNSS